MHYYHSVNGIVEKIVDDFPGTTRIDAVFPTNEKIKDKFDNQVIRVIGFILTGTGKKTTILKYDTIRNKYGEVAIRFKETKNRTINKHKKYQILVMDTTSQEFSSDGKSIVYYPTTIHNMGNQAILDRLVQCRDEWVSKLAGDEIEIAEDMFI